MASHSLLNKTNTIKFNGRHGFALGIPNVDGLWIGVQKVDGKVYLICTTGDRLTSRSIADNRLTIIRYLFRANPAEFWRMGDKMTRQRYT